MKASYKDKEKLHQIIVFKVLKNKMIQKKWLEHNWFSEVLVNFWSSKERLRNCSGKVENVCIHIYMYMHACMNVEWILSL